MSVNKGTLEAIELAIANKACITGLIGASYPNGPGASGVCRDITLDFGEEQSATLLKGIKAILSPPSPGEAK